MLLIRQNDVNKAIKIMYNIQCMKMPYPEKLIKIYIYI